MISNFDDILYVNIRHFLRTFALLSELIDEPISLLIILEISMSNTQNQTGIGSENHSRFAVPDSERRAANIQSVADSLGLPEDMVRRRIQKLEAQRVVRTVPGGVIVPALFWADRNPLLEENVSIMRRLVAEVDHMQKNGAIWSVAN